jgi:putative ABC transport system permease protein
LGKKTENFRCLGLALSNGAAGISGALTAQQNGYADVTMGFGVTLIGIATVLIGTHLIKSITTSNTLSITHNLIGCFVGTFVYFFFITLLLMSGINPLYLKSVFAIVLAASLYLTSN